MKKIAILSLSLTLAAAAQAQTAEFDYFKYAGNDARFNVEIDKTHQYYNPVLAGFYPDPSQVCLSQPVKTWSTGSLPVMSSTAHHRFH